MNSKTKYKQNNIPFKSVFILGGSSEIANAICLELIRKGTKKIHLVSKDIEKTQKFINLILENYETKITLERVDLLKTDLEKTPQIDFFDLYIIAAGYLRDSTEIAEDNKESINISRINYFALIPWLTSITNKNRISKKGSLWILSSVAGDIGRPSNYHYGSAKAAITIFSEGLFHKCYDKPFKVRIIKAGFIYTSMSKAKAPKIFCVSKEYYAKSILRNPYKDGIEYLPWYWFLIMKLIKILPRKIVSML